MRVSGRSLIGITPRAEGMGGSLADRAEHTRKQAGFGRVLAEAVERVNEMEARADREAEKIATGESRDIHAALVAMQEAELAVELTVQVVQRAIEAYKEISRMQV